MVPVSVQSAITGMDEIETALARELIESAETDDIDSDALELLKDVHRLAADCENELLGRVAQYNVKSVLRPE
jgi:hypothetical protein